MLRLHSRSLDRLVRAFDTLVVAGATYVASCAVADQAGASDTDRLVDAALSGIIWALVASRIGLYKSRRTERFVTEARLLLEATLAGLGLAVLVVSGLRSELSFSPLIATAAVFPTLLAGRFVLRRALNAARRRGWNTRVLVVVGSGAGARTVLERIENNEGYGIKVRGWVGSTENGREFPIPGIEHLGGVHELPTVLARECPDYVLLCPSAEARYADVQEVFRLCDEAGVQCQYAPDHLTPRNLKPVLQWIDDVPVYAFLAEPRGRLQIVGKRVMDFTIAGLAVVAMLPVFFAIAVAIKLHDGGPVLFKQRRVGRRGRTFPCFKFRTMVVDAEARLATIATLNEVDGPVFKIKADPRVTRLGRFLRKYSLDELPQLFNVLRGEMSIVGPRPPLPSEVEKYDWWQRRRISVRPGLTCIWQVYGRNKVSFERWMQMDLEYIDRWNLWMDCKIIARTAIAMFKGTGQ